MGIQDKHRRQWPEAARLVVIEAVIQIEVQGRVNRKWDRVADLLPLDLRHRTWNHRLQKFNTYAFKRLFDGILREYRDLTQNRSKRSHQYKLTSRVYEIMKRREEILDDLFGRRAGKRLKSRTSISIRSTNQNRPLPANLHSSSPCSQTEQGESSQGQSARTALVQENAFFSESNNMSGEDKQRNQHDHATTSTTAPRSVRECEDSEDSSGQVGIRIRASSQTPGQGRHQQLDSETSKSRPSSNSRASFCDKSMTTSPSWNDDLAEILEGSIGRVELELSHLNSWVNNRLIPAGKKVVKASYAIRREVHADTETEPVDKHVYRESISRVADIQIRASFQNLRYGFEKMLMDTSAEVTQQLRQVFKEQEGRNR